MQKKAVSKSFSIVAVHDGESAPYYFQEWFAWSNMATTSSVTTEPTPNGGWQTSIPAQGSYSYLWRKSIRYVWQEGTRTYLAEAAQYFRMSGTNGTSITPKGAVKVIVKGNATLPTTGMVSGDLALRDNNATPYRFNGSSWSQSGQSAYTDGASFVVTASCNYDADGNGTAENVQGYMFMWSAEASKWISLGQFKGESGTTYYTHVVWATGVTYSGSTVTAVTGYTSSKSPNDTTHLWMGTHVDTNSSDPVSGDDAILKQYTWTYTKGVDGKNAAEVVLSPSVVTFKGDDKRYVYDTQAYEVQVMMKQNGNTCTVSNSNIGSKPSGVSFSVSAGRFSVRNDSPDYADIEGAAVITVYGTYNGVTYIATGTLNIVVSKAGENGENSVRLALDNEHEDFIYDDAGDNKSGSITSQARLYDGTTEKTGSVTEWRVSANGGTTWGTSVGSNSGDTAFASISTAGLLTVSGLLAATSKVKVRAKYNDVYYYADFTGNKIKQDKYELQLTPSSIAFNPADYTMQTISIKVQRTDLLGNKTNPAISTTANSGNLRVFRAWVQDNGTLGTMSRMTGTSLSVTGDECLSYAGLYFELRYYFNSSASDSGSALTYRVCDYETVEIAKASNGDDAVTYGIVFDAYSSSHSTDNKQLAWSAVCRVVKTTGSNTEYTTDGSVQYSYDNGGWSNLNKRTSDYQISKVVGGLTVPYKTINFRYVLDGTVLATASQPISIIGATGVGKTGRMYYIAGQWSSSKTYTRTDDLCPVVYYDTKWWYLKYGTDTGHAPADGSEYWGEVADFGIVLTDAIFVKQFAQFGSAIITGDWLISLHGTINGTPYGGTVENPDKYPVNSDTPAYTWFDPASPASSIYGTHSVGGNTWTGYNFVPNYAVDLRTGRSYQQNAYIKGEVHATSGVFSGLLSKTPTTITSANIADYVIQPMSQYGLYLDFTKTGTSIVFTDLSESPIIVVPNVPGWYADYPEEEREFVRTLVGNIVTVYNRSSKMIQFSGNFSDGTFEYLTGTSIGPDEMLVMECKIKIPVPLIIIRARIMKIYTGNA